MAQYSHFRRTGTNLKIAGVSPQVAWYGIATMSDDHQTLLGTLTETRIKGIFVLRVAIGSLALGTQCLQSPQFWLIPTRTTVQNRCTTAIHPAGYDLSTNQKLCGL